MPEATNPQVQAFIDARIRPRAEQLRALMHSMADDAAQISDVFTNANDGASTFADNRTDVPHLCQKSDVLSYSALCALMAKVWAGTATLADVAQIAANTPIVVNLCVRPVNQS